MAKELSLFKSKSSFYFIYKINKITEIALTYLL